VGPLVVDPEALFAAGSAVVAAGDGLNASLAVLTSGFAAHTGLDAAGEVFGLGYQDAAEQLLKAAAAAVNACRQSGALIQQGASNYSKAEAASTLGGGADVLPAPSEPVKIGPPGPPGTWGKGEPPPLLWAVVESFVDDVWPDGDVAGLHAAAACWRSFGAAVGGMKMALNASKSLIDGQQIPEGGKIDDALSKIGDCMGQLGEQSGKLATSLDAFADEVDQAHHHIRDLLNRLGSLADLGHDVMLIIKGDALEEIKRIARDINDVLHDLGREARAAEQGMKLGMQIVDGLVVKLEKYTRTQLKDFLGDAVGNKVATVFDTWVNANEGVLKGAVGMAQALGDLDPRWFLLDPKGAADTWTGLGESLWKGSLINGLLNPEEAGQADLQMFKSLLHLDDWSTARPGLGFGENLFDVGTLFLPGAGEAGAAADGAGAVARGAEAAGAAGRAGERAAGGLGEIAGARGALADISKTSGDLTKKLEGVTGDLPKFDPPVSGRPVALPPGKPLDAPVESVPRAPDAATGTRAPQSPGTAPAHAVAGGPHEPVPAVAGERLPSTVPQLVEHSPAELPVSASGSPVEPASVAAHSSQPAPPLSSAAPHATPPGGRPSGLPPPGSGAWHGPGDGGAPGGRPLHGPGDGGPYGPGDGSPGGDRANGPPQGPGDRSPQDPRQPDSGASGENGSPQPHDAGSGEASSDNGFVGPYPLPAPELVAPPPDGAFFWSGRTSEGLGIGPTSAGGSGAADSYAASHGGSTLEGLLDRNGVEPPKWSFDDTAAQEWWSQVSGIYADNVRGDVHAVIGSNLRPGSVWEMVELPRLMDNPNVSKIDIIDPETGSETTIFER
jgi:hypothetical protein